jgi:LPXTG-motif cell wall-anchored protein
MMRQQSHLALADSMKETTTMKLQRLYYLLATGSLCLLLSALMAAQVQTESTTSKGQPTVETKVERGEVVAVSGNDLVVKMEDGQIRDFPNVPESVKITVNGQQLSVHDLKPGMKLERTITTTNTPQTVTTVKSVTGTVWQVMPPNSVILTLEDGTNEQFRIPEGQKFNINGQEVDAFHLRKGMRVSATKIVTTPKTVLTQERKVTGEMPPPPPPPTEAIQGPLLIVVQKTQTAQVAQAKPPAQAQPAPQKLPQTGSELPLIGFIGTLVLLSGVVLFAFWGRAH